MSEKCCVGILTVCVISSGDYWNATVIWLIETFHFLNELMRILGFLGKQNLILVRLCFLEFFTLLNSLLFDLRTAIYLNFTLSFIAWSNPKLTRLNCIAQIVCEYRISLWSRTRNRGRSCLIRLRCQRTSIEITNSLFLVL